MCHAGLVSLLIEDSFEISNSLVEDVILLHHLEGRKIFKIFQDMTSSFSFIT